MPFVTLLTGIFQYAGTYGDDLSNFGSAYPYLAAIQNFSQCWALYCLVLFYKATCEKLEPIRPLHKFLCIKMVVFFTWWQDFLIEVLVHFKVIKSVDLDGHGASPAEEVASLLSNFIICLEMMFMAAGFYFSTPLVSKFDSTCLMFKTILINTHGCMDFFCIANNTHSFLPVFSSIGLHSATVRPSR
jgi:hypothetical protein